MAGKAKDIQQVRVRLICLVPPPAQHERRATEFGLQDKAQELHPGDALADGALMFNCVVTITDAASAARFGGPFAHGKPGDQFLYLGWRPRDAERGAWIRRAKISLNAIVPEQLARVAVGNGLLQARIRAIDASRPQLLDGGWTVVRS